MLSAERFFEQPLQKTSSSSELIDSLEVISSKLASEVEPFECASAAVPSSSKPLPPLSSRGGAAVSAEALGLELSDTTLAAGSAVSNEVFELVEAAPSRALEAEAELPGVVAFEENAPLWIGGAFGLPQSLGLPQPLPLCLPKHDHIGKAATARSNVLRGVVFRGTRFLCSYPLSPCI